MPRKLLPLAVCYDFDGTLAPGNMQERDFIPAVGMTTRAFWREVNERCKKHEADNILIYMGLMLEKANAHSVPVRREDFGDYGKKLQLFPGAIDWFPRITKYGQLGGFSVSHHVISSGIREMILGSPVARFFENIYASSFVYDHHGVAKWPALALNYTTKTQYLFRINKGVKHVFDHSKINDYVPPEERPIPFTNMIFVGDGETDVPCFRLVKELGGHSIAVYRPRTKNARQRSDKLVREGRVHFAVPADYSEGKGLDRAVKAIMEKVAADNYVRTLGA